MSKEKEMKKVKEIYYDEMLAKADNSATGLILVFEDGSAVKAQSTDVVMPFEPIALEFKEEDV